MIHHRHDTTKLTTVSMGVMPGDWPGLSVSQKAAAISAKYPGINTQTLIDTITRLDAKHPVRPRIEYRERTVVVPARAAGQAFSSPDFTTRLLDAYWRYVEGSFSNVCVTSGYDFLIRLRSVLGLSAQAVWDASVQSAIVAQLAQFTQIDPAWQTVLSAAQSDQASQSVGNDSLHTGVFLAYYRANGRRYDSIMLQPGTIPPAWGQQISPPPAGQQSGLRCYDESIDPDPRAATSDQIAQAIANSLTGVRIEPGRPAPSSSTNTIDRSSGVTPLTVLLFSALFLGVGVLVMKK